MAGLEETSSQTTFAAFSSYETALCWIPEREDWSSIDGLRSLYDKAYEKWPPHINLIYPFVAPESLSAASDAILSGLLSWKSETGMLPTISLNSTGVFSHRNGNTIYLADSNESRRQALARLRTEILTSLSQKPSNNFNMHMTIGQSQDLGSDSHHFLLQKVGLLPVKEWRVGKLHILVREKVSAGLSTKVLNHMTTWGTIDLDSLSVDSSPKSRLFYNPTKPKADSDDDGEAALQTETDEVVQQPYVFDESQGRWTVEDLNAKVKYAVQAPPTTMTVASYNVLAEFLYPISYKRYPILVRNILDQGGRSDVLVLQEVTDDFLTYLLNNVGIREQYTYVSHGPPHQDDIEPLPSHLNVVVLSRFYFTWKRVTFKRRHKSSIVAQFPTLMEKIGDSDSTGAAHPLVLATVHLTCGLTDGSVTAKKLELQAVLRYLKETHSENPWVLAGDFNISTSAHTVDVARRKGAVSAQTVAYLRDLEAGLFDAGFVDSWATAKIQRGDGRVPASLTSDFNAAVHDDLAESFEGEEGATFDPLVNDLAAEIVGSGFNMRPQRYDRILVKGQDAFHVTGFNMFGQDLGVLGSDSLTSGAIAASDEDQASRQGSVAATNAKSFGSDHWGVRCRLKISPGGSAPGGSGVGTQVTPVEVVEAQGSLEDVSVLKACLASQKVFPSTQDAETREQALQLLKEVVLQVDAVPVSSSTTATTTTPSRGQPAFVVVPVGSYGLGVWTPSSDIDCLCIGPVSSKVFFSLAVQRLRKAEQQKRYQVERDGVTTASIRLIRRVNAHSGTMLELDVLGVKMDLQYCASAFIAETWPYATRVAPTDPTFQLSSQALAKLKPMRDLYYLRRTIPDYAAFRTAFLAIKFWAKQHGIYSAKFGYLGGIHISVMLARVCKMVCHNAKGHGAGVSAATILTTFFSHYAGFDWQTNAVYDPFFHTEAGSGRALRYIRTAREPLAILGWHGPSLNVAAAASVPSTNTIAEEFRRAAARLATDGATWSDFLNAPAGFGEAVQTPAPSLSSSAVVPGAADEFLTSYKSYIKIEAQFWGVSLAKGTGFIGWLESRCTMLLVDVDRRVPGIHARIWPARFVSKESTPDDDDADAPALRDYKGYYLAGLEPSGSQSQKTSVTSAAAGVGTPVMTQMTKDESRLALGALRTALDKFETQIRGDERFFDAKSCWMSASISSQKDLGDLRLDDREWGEYTIGEDDDDEDEDEEDEEDEFDDDELSDEHTSRSNKKRGGGKGSSKPLPSRPAYEGKFRSSADVMSRLRWDPDLDSSEYVVGYEDRFLGVRERALDAWKSEQTDEEFIPQHRILYFKRRAGGGGDSGASASTGTGGAVGAGTIVWDRRERVDEIFGTGVSSLSK
ncbi:poly(A) polymerase [Microdochium nivale]|nr:poly(A) polymerase [Microdochium nivale]